MKAGNWKNYQEFCSATDWMEPEDCGPNKEEMWEDWIKSWEDTFGKADKETEDVLWEFFDKIVYHEYFDNWLIYSDWSLKEIKEKLLDWLIVNYNKAIEQLGYLIRDTQRNNLINKHEESDVLKQSRFLYTDQTGTCI